MCRAQCVLALVSLCLRVVHSWDIAVTAGDQLLFYTNGIKTHNVSLKSQNLTALVYDEVHNVMLYVDKQSNNDAICGYDLSSKDNECFIKRNGRNIHGLAFDPVTEIIFFTDTNERSINFISLGPGSKNNVYGNLLIKMDEENPSSISVDSCSRYIYWTNTNPLKPTIERARFDGSDREVVIDTTITYAYATYIYEPHSLFVDQQTQKLYWIEDKMQYSQHDLKSADLNGENKKYLLAFRQQLCPPSVMTVSKDSVYWVGCSRTNNSVNQLPKNAADNNVHPEHLIMFTNEKPAGVAANYKIEEQTKGIQQCETIRSFLKNKSLTNDSFNMPNTVGPFKVNGHSSCKCIPVHNGGRCNISVCENYCLQGNCSINDERLPECRCNSGYSGHRCEVNLCFNYCLNNGDCYLNEKDEPVCQCVDNHEGSRCETVKIVNLTNTNIPTYYSAGRNLTLADFLSNWQKRTTKISVTVQV